jgi:hypothetical protein
LGPFSGLNALSGQSDLRSLFGLGDYSGPVDVEVRMPGARRFQLHALPSGRLHTLELTTRR